MTIAGILGPLEIMLILFLLVIFLFPAARVFLGRRENMTEKLDQIERLERLYRDGTLTEKQFKREKSKVLRRR